MWRSYAVGGLPPFKLPFDLTGIWQANDGGTYYLIQIGNELWWNGMSGGNDGRSFNNVFHGELKWIGGKEGIVISGEWLDVPRGRGGASGTLDLRVGGHPPNTLQKLTQSGSGFGDTTWQKVR